MSYSDDEWFEHTEAVETTRRAEKHRAYMGCAILVGGVMLAWFAVLIAAALITAALT